MAWTRRSAPTKKVTKKTTSTKKVAKSTMGKQLATLKAQVKKMSKISYDNVELYSTIAQNQSLTTPYNAYNLSTSVYNCLPVWGYSTADITNCDKAYLRKKVISVSVRQSNEPNLIRYSMFLVSLKDQGADSITLDPATGALTMSNLNHYTSLGADQYRISPRFFNIHAVRKFTMGYEGTAGPTADTQSERRFRFVIKPQQPLYQNPKGNLFQNAGFLFPKDPSQNYFIILFNDNLASDLQDNKVDVTVSDLWSINK